MTWNYRVVHKVYKGVDEYAIHEVYYDDDGAPKLVTTNSISPYGNTYKEFIDDMAHYVAALGRPIIEYDDIDWWRGSAEEFLDEI